MDLVEEAHQLSQRHLESLERRWRHVQAVAACSRDLVQILPDSDRSCVVAAAWLHDIGYAPALAVTGFHPVDGAMYLDRLGAFLRSSCSWLLTTPVLHSKLTNAAWWIALRSLPSPRTPYWMS